MEPNTYTPYSDQEPTINQQPTGLQMTNPMSTSSNTTSNTTVIVQQPQMGMVKSPRLWTTGLMDCCDDVSICLCGLFCGGCLVSQISTDLGESCCVPCCVPGGSVALRLKWRMQENIQGSIMDDCCTLVCCGPCALCQLAREIKYKRNGVIAFPN